MKIFTRLLMGQKEFLTKLFIILLLFSGGYAHSQCGTYQVFESFTGALPTQGGPWAQTSISYGTTSPRTGLNTLSFNAAADVIRTPQIVSPGVFSFWYRRSTTSATHGFVVETSPDNTTWTPRGTAYSGTMSTTYVQYSVDLGALSLTNVYVRVRDTRPSGTTLWYLDDMSWTSTTSSENTTIIPTLGSSTSCTQTITCGTTYTLYDVGGVSDQYPSTQNNTVILTPSDNTKLIKVTVNSCVTESSSSCFDYDWLKIFNGTGTGGTLINWIQTGCATRPLPSAPITSTDASGNITIQFKADGSTNAAGFSITVECVAAAACPIPTATAATLVTSTTAQANWTPGTGTYILEYGPTATFGTPGTDATAGNANNTVVTVSSASLYALTGLASSTGYSYVVRQDCTGAGNGYSANSSTITFTTPAPPPANDDPCGAISLTPSTTCSFTQYTNATATATSATAGGAIPTPTCSSYLGGDVWFSVTVPANGILTFDSNTGVITDGGMAVYASSDNTCDGIFTQIGCDDDSGTGSMPYLSLTGLTGGNTVFVRFFEYGNNGNGTFSICVTTPAACPAPTATAATLVAGTTAQANWTPGTGTYIVEYGPTATFGTPGTGATAGNVNNTVVTITAASLASLTGLTPVTGYSYVVRQDCSGAGNGYSTNSNTITFTTLVACPAPTASAATLVTATTARANWTPGTGSYILEYGPTATFGTPGTDATAGNANNTVVAVSAANFYVISGLTGSTGYSYVVRQDCTGASNGYSTNSSTITFTTLAPPPANDDPCGAISLTPGTTCSFTQYTNATATATSTTAGGAIPTPTCSSYLGGDVWFSVVVPANGILTFDSNTGVITDGGMTVYASSDNTCNGVFTQINCNDDDSANGLMPYLALTGLTAGNTVFVRFFEYDNNNNGTFSICVTTPAACPAPTATAATLVAGTTAQANWTPGTGTYIVEYGPTATFGTPGTGASAGNVDNTVVTITAATLASLTGLTPVTGYSYVVRQDCSGAGNGYSANSSTITFTTLVACPAPTASAATLVTATTARANWTPGTGSYILEYGPTATFGTPGTDAMAGNANNTVVAVSAANFYVISGLTASTGYSYVVRQDCTGASNGYSTNSSTITFTTPAAPPANDACAGAIVLACGGTVTGNNTNATDETLPGVTCGSTSVGTSRGVWYTITPETTGAVTLATCTGTTWDTYLRIYTGSCGSFTACTDFDDDGCSESSFGLSETTFSVIGGTTYYIMVTGYDSGDFGAFTLAAACAPANNDCSGAININGNGGQAGQPTGVPIAATTVGATQSLANTCGGDADDDVWFTYTTDTDGGNVTINVTPSGGFDPVIELYSGSCGAPVSIACTNATQLTFTGQAASTTYFIRVYDFGTGLVGDVEERAAGGFTIAVLGSALPIELTSFTGKTLDHSNLLQWTTATERNVQSHNIERSLNGINNWTLVGQTASKGDAQTAQSYSLEDRAPLTQSYYRLRTVDNDGQEQLSQVITLTRKDARFGILSAFPNPATESIAVQFNTNEEGTVTARITDVTGRLVAQQQMGAEKGINMLPIQLGQLSAGTYFVTLQNGSNITEPVRFVKQ